jgi:hypothetical protein
MDVTKNYLGNVGAKACWTCCSETGEIACAVLVPNTSAGQYAHAAEQVARRSNFRPKVMYADTWPHLDKFWNMILGPHVKGRLGLFHFMHRIVRTLRDSHQDYRLSIWKLKHCFWEYEATDYESVIFALTTGILGKTIHKYSHEEISEMQINGRWKQRYEKWLRKRLLPTNDMIRNLENWWIRFKVENSPGEALGRGRIDIKNGKKLFTPETKGAVVEAKKSCHYIGDVLSIEDMYTALPPSQNSKHGLREFICHRVESKLEKFHGPLSHFGNTGMSASLADTLHIAGTARYNCSMRQKRIVLDYTDEERKMTPSHFLSIPPFP